MSQLFLGKELDAHDQPEKDDLLYESSHLVTHGVIVGMTGSGKTGLGVVLLEEVLRKGIPAIIIDPKGDMPNLCLGFPSFSSEEFAPWLSQDGNSNDDVQQENAKKTAQKWKSGLANHGLTAEDIQQLHKTVTMEVYTPGSKAGTPVNILGSLSIPEDMDWESTQAETVRAEISGYTSGLLGLVDIDAHPLSSREHILISNLLEYRLSQGAPVDLPGLIHDIQDPPLRKLGVLDLDSFFPQKDRQSLALRLNGLLANPSFAPWLAGDPLDIDTLLHTSSGSPKASILYLSHLSAKERQFVVSLVLSKVATWMQTQTGTQNLRALVYIDEVYGFVPPTAAPPSKKPILTLLKQARAFGVGLVLSTQNPVDLDYKAMSNAGTWMVGRLQTERDKERILEALRSANGDADVSELSKRIGGLGKRQFLLYQTKSTTQKYFLLGGPCPIWPDPSQKTE